MGQCPGKKAEIGRVGWRTVGRKRGDRAQFFAKDEGE